MGTYGGNWAGVLEGARQMMMHSPVRHRQARDGALEALNVIEHMTAAQAEGEREGTLREVIKEVRRFCLERGGGGVM